MIRSTPIKDEYYKTDIYLKHQKLINKLAHRYMNSINLDFEDCVSEFNFIFCKAIRKYKPGKGYCFSTYLYTCCQNRVYSIIKLNSDPKRNQEGKIELNDFYYLNEFTPEDKVIIFDSFSNHSNPVIKSITSIVSTYKLPNKAIKTWLKDILRTYGFSYPEISKAFKIIKTLY